MAPLLLTRPADAPPETLAEYRARGGYEALARVIAHEPPESVTNEVARAQLRGRGGAGFLTAKKWEIARATDGTPKYLVANGGEHEPGSLKDRYIVTRYPHAVLEGMALCAYATGASIAYLYLIEDMADALASARAAIDEASVAHLLGPQVLGSDFSLDVQLQAAPLSYVAGEETAALEVIEGRKAWPRKKPPYPGAAGLFGKPTTVNNVETLAFVPSVLRMGADAFRQAATMLFTLDDSLKRPGVYELPIGTTFRQAIYDVGGGPRNGSTVKGILPALSSAFLSAKHLDLAADYESVKQAGSNLGCGGLSVLASGCCAVERVVQIAEFFMKAQCGQCPPCRMETNTLATVVKQVQAGTSNDYRAQIAKITAFARGKGLCSLIEMAAAPVLSALECFPEDFEHHAKTGKCPTY